MNIPLTPLINGKSYEWSNIVLNILNTPFVGVTSLKYGEKQDMQNVYGAGSYPVSRGYGKVEPTASITLLMEEVQNIIAIAPLGSLQRIPEFDITVSYVDDSLTVVNHVIKNCRFMNNNIESSTGDTSIGIELELITSHIKWK